MGSLTVFVALTWMVTSHAAPVTEFFGAPQIIEDGSNSDYLNPDKLNKVKEMERFHRTYKNGTVEFKMALSNGHVQYQRISSKIVDGDKVQVFEGYYSEQYKDGRYATRYYAADENGYRSSAVIVENDPPKLPTSGPYSANLPRDIQNQLSPLNEDDTETQPKTLIDNLVDLEEEQLPNLNQGSNIANENSISTTESEIVKHLEKEVIIEEPSVEQNLNEVQTELSLNLDLSSSTEFSSSSVSENNYGKGNEEPLSAFEEGSEINGASEASTEQLEATTEANKFEAPSDLSTLDDEQSVKKDLSENPSYSSKDLSESVEDVKVPNEEPITIVPNLDISTEQPIYKSPEASPETLLNEEVTLTEQSTKTVLTDDTILTNAAEEEELTKVLTEQPLLETIENKSIESIVPETETESNSDLPTSSVAAENENKMTEVNDFSTEKSNIGENESEIPTDPIEDIIPSLSITTEKAFDEVSEATTNGQLLNDEVTPTEQSPTFNNELNEPSTEVPATNEEKTDVKTSRNLRYPLEDSESEATAENISKNSAEEEELTKFLTEQPSIEVIEDKSTESITTSENESNNSDLPASSPVLENERTVLMDDSISKKTSSEEETNILTEQPLLEIIEGKSIKSIGSETETVSNSDLPTSSVASENENKITEVNDFSTEKSDIGENESEIPADSIEDIIPSLAITTEKSFDEISEATTTGQLLNDEVTPTEQSPTFNNEANEPSTEVPATNEEKTDVKTSRNLRYPLDDSESEATAENISINSAEEEELTKFLTEQPSIEVIEDKSTKSIGTSENESNNSDLPASSPVLENETNVLTDDNIAKISSSEEETNILTENKSIESIGSEAETESNSDLPTSSPALENETQSTEINELSTEKLNSDGVSTDLPIEDSTNVDEEASGEVPNDQDSFSSEKDGRSLDILKVIPLPENNLTSIAEGSGSGSVTNEEETNISSTSIISEINEETTNKIELSTEQSESSTEEVTISTASADQNNNADTTTEEEVILTTQENDFEASSSEKSEDNITEKDNQISTDQIPVLTSSKEISNEETKEESKENSNEQNKEKSTEDKESTEILIGSSEEDTEHSTEAEVLSTTDETEEKSSVVEVEFDPPVINF